MKIELNVNVQFPPQVLALCETLLQSAGQDVKPSPVVAKTEPAELKVVEPPATSTEVVEEKPPVEEKATKRGRPKKEASEAKVEDAPPVETKVVDPPEHSKDTKSKFEDLKTLILKASEDGKSTQIRKVLDSFGIKKAGQCPEGKIDELLVEVKKVVE